MKHARRRIGSILLVLALTVTLLPTAARAEEGAHIWDGSADTEWYNTSDAAFTITTAEELAGLAQLVNGGESFSGKTVTLGGNIDLDGREWTPIGTSGKPFNGTFDGQGHTIFHLSIGDQALNCAGLFGKLTAPGMIRDVTIQNVAISAQESVGALVGNAFTGTVRNIHITGSITIRGNYKLGGLVGEGYAALVDCTVDGARGSTVTAVHNGSSLEGDNVGGLIGFIGEGKALRLDGCSVSGLTVTGTRKVGGLAGSVFTNNDIQDCTVEDVTVISSADASYVADNQKTIAIGGLVGLYTGNGSGNGSLSGCTVRNITLRGDADGVRMGYLVGGMRGNVIVQTCPPSPWTQSGNRVAGTNTGGNMPGALANGVFSFSLEEAVEAAQSGTVKLLSDVVREETDPGASNVLALDGITLDLNGHTLTALNFSLVFEGSDFSIRNGALACADGGSYALFIGDGATRNVLLEDLQTTGGINIYNADNVVLRNVDVSGTNDYAVWCDAEGRAAIESGTFRSAGKAVLGLAENISDDQQPENVNSSLRISGGNFITSDGQALVLDDGRDRNKPVISGGRFTADPSEYVAAGKTAAAETAVLDGVTYSYVVKDQTVSGGSGDSVDATVSAGTPSVTVPEGSLITEDDLKNAMADSNANLADAVGGGLSSDTEVTGTREEAVEALKGSSITVEETTAVTVVVEPYLEVTVADHAPDAESLTLEISPYYNVKATTASAPEQMTEHNTVTLKEQQPLEVTAPVEISIPLPGSFPTEDLYVRHTKDGRFVAYHKATVSGSFLTFTNDKGFSTFEIRSDPRAAAVRFDGESRMLRPSDVGGALPTSAAPEGKVFAGWSFAGVSGTHAVLSDELLTHLAAIGGTVTATAVFRDADSADSPSGGGSTGGSSHSYSVSVPAASEIQGGSITVTPRSAREGDTVTITVKPDAGCVLESLTVTERDGGSVDLTRRSGTQYTFTMPAGTVTVKAVFVREGAQSSPEMNFSDVAEGYWAYDEIKWALTCGYMNGTSAGTFQPGGTVTRQQMWMILARMDGAAPADMAAARAWAVESGISDGTNPGGSVSRQQLAAMLYRFARDNGHGFTGAWAFLLDYPDASQVSSYAYEAMCWMTMNGVIGGTAAGTLNPGGPATRAQLAAMLWRFCQNIEA